MEPQRSHDKQKNIAVDDKHAHMSTAPVEVRRLASAAQTPSLPFAASVLWAIANLKMSVIRLNLNATRTKNYDSLN